MPPLLTGEGEIMSNVSNWPKRDDLYAYLDETLVIASEQEQITSVLIVNVDNFHDFCDFFGYDGIGELIDIVGQIIKVTVPYDSYTAWLGADEFAVVLRDTTKQSAKIIAERINHSMVNPITINERRAIVSVSVGVSFYPRDGQTRNDLLKTATVAMNYVKKHGKNAYVTYEPVMSEKITRRMRLINDFSLALSQDQLFLQYQPQVNIDQQTVVGAEALVRWQHPELGLIPPLDFIPLAEETGYIHDIGDWVLTHACIDFNSWLMEGIPLGCLAVNVSALQLLDVNFAQRVLEILEITQLEPAYLELEITESQTANLQRVRPQIETLRNHGVRFAIDDFGTGFSSINHLRHMGFDTIKIDRGFISNIVTNSRDKVIVNSILNMANRLQLRIIAEGVETDEQLEYVRKIAIHEIQGYYYSPPVDSDKFRDLAAVRNK